jgi:hypothetical protein
MKNNKRKVLEEYKSLDKNMFVRHYNKNSKDTFIVWNYKTTLDMVVETMESSEHRFRQNTYESRDGTLSIDGMFIIRSSIGMVLGHKKINNIIGMIDTKQLKNAWDAHEVRHAAAEKGYGPLLYDLALSYCGIITSDRNSVSSYAENIWDHYYSARSDVEKLRFDDIDEPETPPVEDDAKLHPPSRDSLNYAYKLKGSKIYDVDALNRQSEEKIKLLCYDIMDAFEVIKTEYFGEEYAQYKCEFNEEDEEMVIIMIEDMLSQQSKLFFEHKYANQ